MGKRQIGAPRLVFTVTNDLTYDQRMIRICSSLAADKYDVLLVGRRLPQSKPFQERPFQQKRLFCFFKSGKFFYLEYNIRLFFYLLFIKMDLICSIDLDTLLPGWIISGIRRKRLVYDAHEYFTEVPEVVRRKTVQRIWEGLARMIIPRLSTCYTVGPGLASIMGERYNIRFEVIRNVPHQQSLPDLSEKKEPILLYQGVLNEGRGLEALIDSMEALPSFQLWLAGEGDLSDELRARVLQKGLQDRIQFLGYIQPEELKKITPKAWLGFNLLENKGLSYYYSLANKAFDYIQAGLPSVQMAFPEYIQLNEQYQTFLLLDQLEPKGIASIVRELWNKPDRYQQLQQQCRLAASEWVWEEEEKKLRLIYRQLFRD
jgi:glycosyltransferase involved in cell wall biosynthesis